MAGAVFAARAMITGSARLELRVARAPAGRQGLFVTRAAHVTWSDLRNYARHNPLIPPRASLRFSRGRAHPYVSRGAARARSCQPLLSSSCPFKLKLPLLSLSVHVAGRALLSFISAPLFLPARPRFLPLLCRGSLGAPARSRCARARL